MTRRRRRRENSSDRRPYGTWEGAGRPGAIERAGHLAEQLIHSYEAPPLDEGIREALESFVAQPTVARSWRALNCTVSAG